MYGYVALTKRRSRIQLRLSECLDIVYRFIIHTLPLISAPLLPNILPHIQALLNFIINTLPKPVLIALLYRLTILHFASRILPTIGADSWESEEGVDDTWGDRPVSILK